MSPTYSTGNVISKDGTTIGFRFCGDGPGLILVHGGMKSSQDFTKLAVTLSDAFTVHVPDRRGRGLSGPHGDDFNVLREVEDMQALAAATGASYMFGLSAGALVTLRTALATPAIKRIAVYEPPLSIHGSVPTDWLPRHQNEAAANQLAAATVTTLKGLGVEPGFSKLPRWLLVPLLASVMKLQGESTQGKVTIRALVPTMQFDMRIVADMADTLQDYCSLGVPALLLGGARSPAYFAEALGALASTMPNAQRKTFASLGHDGPEDDGQPQLIADELRRFFL